MAALSFIVAVALLMALCNTQEIINNINVTISLGTMTGLHVRTGSIEYFSFRGIPYANATRFKAPTPMPNWTSLVMATNDGDQCAQPSLFGHQLEAPIEDCLFLNVYTPQLPQSGIPKLPVMVFIHGGAFLAGSSNSHMYGPEFYMAEQNVVLVTFNYRLGIFGFLSTGTPDAQGNAGMKDQVMALKFVKQEISNFGGDPDSVTIFGESAGAASVIHHVLSPMSKGLFKRAIAQSGSAVADWTNIDANTAREHATVIARNLSCNTENMTTAVTCLKAMSASALLQASVTAFGGTVGIQGLPFVPVIETGSDEEPFLADHPMNILNNLTDAVPLIIGTNKDEGAFFLPDNVGVLPAIDRNLQYIFTPREIIQHATADQLSAIGQQLRSYYFHNGSVNQSTVGGLVNLLTDQLFMYPTAQTVRKLADKNSTVYLYQFAYSGNYRLDPSISTKLGYHGVTHGEDLGYLFYSQRYNNTDLTQTGSADYQVMKRMVKLWTAFATNSVPSNSTDEVIRNIQWTQVTNASTLNYLDMQNNFNSALDYYKERIAVWDQLSILQTSSAIKIKPAIFLPLFLFILVIKAQLFST